MTFKGNPWRRHISAGFGRRCSTAKPFAHRKRTKHRLNRIVFCGAGTNDFCDAFTIFGDVEAVGIAKDVPSQALHEPLIVRDDV